MSLTRPDQNYLTLWQSYLSQTFKLIPMRVHFKHPKSNHIETLECDAVDEGEEGIHLVELPGRSQVGFIPYDRLYYADTESSKEGSE